MESAQKIALWGEFSAHLFYCAEVGVEPEGPICVQIERVTTTPFKPAKILNYAKMAILKPRAI